MEGIRGRKRRDHHPPTIPGSATVCAVSGDVGLITKVSKVNGTLL